MIKWLFYKSAKWFGEACLELAVLRKTPAGSTEILLLQRPVDDPFWPSQLHIPGTRKLPKDTDKAQITRVMKEAGIYVGIYVNPSTIKYVASMTVETLRGTQFSDIRRVFIYYNRLDENFYDINYLPENIINHQIKIIDIIKKDLNQ
jgi:hypothetical protein